MITSVIRPAPGADGPFYVVTEKDGAVTNVTTGLVDITTALDRVKTDQAAVLSGLTIDRITISTRTI
mgnify:CR=1 FL=1